MLFAFTINGAATGVAPTRTVTVKATSGKSCSAPPAAGGCSLTFSTAARRSVAAAYAGDANYNASTSVAVSQVVQ